MADINKNDDLKMNEEQKLNTLNEFNLYMNEFDTWRDQWQDPEFAEELLKEKLQRLRADTDVFALPGEDDASSVVANSFENSLNKPKHQKQVADWAMIKGGARGASILWNGAVMLGREAWDYENWAKAMDKFRAIVDGPGNTKIWEKGQFEDWAERTKRAGIKRNDDGFWESWGRSVASRKDFAKYGVDPREIEGSNEWSDWMFDEIPFENENLGWKGNAVEILTQEALTMGPLAVLKLRKASKVADWFATKAGAKTHGGKLVIGKDGKEKLITKTGEDAVSHVDILKPGYTGRGMKGEIMDEATQKKYDKLLTIANREGSFAKVLGLQGSNAYAEAEILTSLSVAAAGATMQERFGRGYSVIGEVGAGLAGARPLTWAGRYTMDWMNWARYSFNPLKSKKAKDESFLRMLGYDIRPDGTVVDPNKIIGKNDDGSNLYATVPGEKVNKLLQLGQSRPGFPLFLGFGKGEIRRKLGAYRSLTDQLLEMPSDMREEFIQRIGAIDTLISKYDDGSGRLFATIAQAVNLDVFATIQARAMANKTLGKRVKVKFDIESVRLEKRMAEASEALADMLTQFPDSLWKDAKFRNLVKGFQDQIDATTRRLEQVDYPNIEKYKAALEEKQKVILKLESDGKVLGDDVFDMSVTSDNKLRTGTKIDSTRDIKNDLLIDETDEKLIDNIWSKEGFYEIEVGKDSFGKPITKMWYKRDTTLDRNAVEFENESRDLIDNAFNKDRETAGGFYEALGDNYKVNTLGSVNPNAAGRITADIGQALEDSKTALDTQVRPSIKVKNFEGTIEELLISKRRAALDKMPDEAIKDIYNIMSDNARRTGKENFPNLERIVDDAGEVVEEAIDDVDEIKDALARQIDMALPDNVARNLDLTLQDIVRIRSSLYKTATKSYRKKDDLSMEGVNALLQFRVANKISESLAKFGDDDLIGGWKAANDNWKNQIGNKWTRGLAYKLIANDSKGDKITGAGKIFDKFLDSKGSYSEAANVFRAIFNNTSGDNSLRENGLRLLDEAITRRVRKNGNKEGLGIDPDFWDAFGSDDLINLGSKNTAEFEQLAMNRWKPKAVSAENVKTQLSPIEKKLQIAIDAQESALKNAADKSYDFSDLGVTLEEMQRLANVTNEAQFRQQLLDSTYKGGNPELAQAVFRKIKGNRKAEEAFFKLLYDGAAEEALAQAGKGKGFRYNSATGKFEGNIQVDANAYQQYLQRNKKILEETFGGESAKLSSGETIFERMEELGSVLQLVSGEIGTATMEGLPKNFRVEQIISRVYSIARGVVSPRYVLTELLIQDARFRRGKLLEQIATDPDAALIISEVVSKNGLKNIQTRKDFTNWWVEGMIRVARGDDPSGPGSKLNQYYTAKDSTSSVGEWVGDKWDDMFGSDE